MFGLWAKASDLQGITEHVCGIRNMCAVSLMGCKVRGRIALSCGPDLYTRVLACCRMFACIGNVEVAFRYWVHVYFPSNSPVICAGQNCSDTWHIKGYHIKGPLWGIVYHWSNQGGLSVHPCAVRGLGPDRGRSDRVVQWHRRGRFHVLGASLLSLYLDGHLPWTERQ
jgi:hypothetical protein